MKKQGFTLIELMVVIVIMGILAAVAVPKLFGMIAKSKASEVGPAAGTYVKMQQAYISEAVAIGNWKIIGYSAPGSNNFDYSEGTISWSNNTTALGNTAVDGWNAKNNVKLNDCGNGQINWKMSIKASTTSGAAAGDAEFAAGVSDKDNYRCLELTPNFLTIGTPGTTNSIQ